MCRMQQNQPHPLAGRFDIDPGVIHHFCAGVYAKQMKLPKGYMAVSHQHAYDHMSILAVGKVIVEADGATTTYMAPACIQIKAGIRHQITAIEDAHWFCIHATDETDPEKVDQVLIQGA